MSTGRGHTTVLHLSWRRDDPLAVSLALVAEPDHPALPQGTWVVLRDFLRYALEEPTGDGDVRLSPDPLRGRLVLQLARGRRPCLVSVSAAQVREFLDRTEQVVPTGQEASEEAMDALINRLLER